MALTRYLAKRRLKKLIGSYELPSFSAVTIKVLDELHSPNTNATHIAQTISADPGLSVRVLALVNSAAYSYRHPINTLHQAVALLGVSAVETLVLAAAVRGAIPHADCPGFDARVFWKTCARRAVIARELSRSIDPTRVSDAFTAGLLQDLAVPLLAGWRPKDYAQVMQIWRSGELPLPDAESQVLGFDHAQVGGWIASAWGLPDALAEMVAGHHGAEGECPPAVRAVATVGRTPKADDATLAEELSATVSVPTEHIAAILLDVAPAADTLAAAFA